MTTRGPGNLRREWRDLSQISPQLQLAVIAAEDQRFPEHSGFDFKQIRKALDEAENGGRSRGASTISQQVAKNLFLWAWPQLGAQGARGLVHAADRSGRGPSSASSRCTSTSPSSAAASMAPRRPPRRTSARPPRKPQRAGSRTPGRRPAQPDPLQRRQARPLRAASAAPDRRRRWRALGGTAFWLPLKSATASSIQFELSSRSGAASTAEPATNSCAASTASKR